MAGVTSKSTVWPCATAPSTASTGPSIAGCVLQVTVRSSQLQPVIAWRTPPVTLWAFVTFATWSRTWALVTWRTPTPLTYFDYRSDTDFTERWEDRTYDLSRLGGVDLFMSFWGPTLLAHTIVSWEFDDGRHLAVSIETRKERGEVYSALRGFFRQYELYYVVADERDVVRLRTN